MVSPCFVKLIVLRNYFSHLIFVNLSLENLIGCLLAILTLQIENHQVRTSENHEGQEDVAFAILGILNMKLEGQ